MILCILLISVASSFPLSANQSPRSLEDANEIAFLHKFNVLYQNCFPQKGYISYKLCPNKKECKNGCENGGEYLVDFYEFLDAFTEMQLKAHEYRCEMIRENCEDDDAEACYEAAGYYKECYKQDQEDEEYQLQQYLEGCVQYEGYDIWVKPYCHDTINIYLGVYADDECEEEYDVDNWDADEMGEDFPEIPYSQASGQSIIEKQCAKCREHGKDEDKNGGDDADDEDNVIEQCELLYEDHEYACETSAMYKNAGIDGLYPDESGCEAISNFQDAEDNFVVQPILNSSRSTAEATIAAIAGVVAVAAIAGVAYQYSRGKTPTDKQVPLTR